MLKKTFAFIISLMLLCCLLGGCAYVEPPFEPTPTPTAAAPTPGPTATPTPLPELREVFEAFEDYEDVFTTYELYPTDSTTYIGNTDMTDDYAAIIFYGGEGANELRLLNLHTGEGLSVDLDNNADNLAFCEDGLLYVWSYDLYVYKYDMQLNLLESTYAMPSALEDSYYSCYYSILSPDGSHLLASMSDGLMLNADLADPESSSYWYFFGDEDEPICLISMNWLDDGKTVSAINNSTYDCIPVTFDTESGEITELSLSDGWTSIDGDVIYSEAGIYRAIQELDRGETVMLTPTKDLGEYWEFYDNGIHVITRYSYDEETGGHNEINLIRVQDGTVSLIDSITLTDSLVCFEISEDYALLICADGEYEGSGSNTYLLWDYADDGSEATAIETITYSASAPWDEIYAYADSLGNRYGADIYIYEEVEGYEWDYAAEVCTDPALTLNALLQLEDFLSQWGDNCLTEMNTVYDNPIKLYLASTLTAVNSYNITTAAGVSSYTEDARVLIFDITDAEDIRKTIAHEFMHLCEDKIYRRSSENGYDLFGYWEAELTGPEGSAVYNYGYYNSDGSEYSDMTYTMDDYGSDEIWFVDYYSKTQPNEDRARIFEHLYNEALQDTDFFGDNENVIAKGRYLCAVLRLVFADCMPEEPVAWEERYGIVDFYTEYADLLTEGGYTIEAVG